MTEPLFRFLVLRPPVVQDPNRPSIVLAQNTKFQTDLAAAAATSEPRTALVNVSKTFIASSLFVSSDDVTPFQKKVVDFSTKIDQTEFTKSLEVKDVVTATKAAFGQEPKEVVKTDDFKKLTTGLRDSVVAIKYVQEEHSRPIAALTDQLRDLELIQKVTEPSTLNRPALRSPLAPAYTPKWTANSGYSVQDRVVYERVIYECIEVHMSKTTWVPPATPTLWKRAEAEAEHGDELGEWKEGMDEWVDGKDEWKHGNIHNVGDRITFQGGTYECIHAHTSKALTTPSTTPTLWKLLDIAPKPTSELSLFRRRPLLLPVEADLKSIIGTSPAERQQADDERRKAAKAAEAAAQQLLNKHADLTAAIDELVKLNPEHIEVKVQPSHLGSDVAAKFTRVSLVGAQIDYHLALRNIALTRTTPSPPPTIPRLATGETGSSASSSSPAVEAVAGEPEPVAAFGLAKNLMEAATFLSPKGKYTPLGVEERTPRWKSTALTVLSERTKKVLTDRAINLKGAAVNEIIKTLRQELSDHVESLKELAPSGENTSFTRFGPAFIATRSPIISRVTSLLYGVRAPISITALPVLPIDGRVPHTKGKVSSAGVGDLLVVKQTLRGYRSVDIAHVENVLKGESKQRTHTKTTRTETIISTETETNTTDEHELSSTSRFEMSKEASNTLKEDQSLKADLKVSAKYGPAVTIDASVEGSVSRSKEEVNKTASKFGQDVTERTVKKIAERVLQKQTTTTISEIVERNEHGINNASGTGHISGVYQWLNKVYEAQVFNYGLRTMFEFMIPEPAAFITYALSSIAHNSEADLILEKPSPFTLTPSGVSEESIGYLITKYQATDVLPPPEDYITVSDQAKAGGGDSKTNYDHGALITIPSGYEAVYATISIVWNIWDKDKPSIDVMVGSETHRFSNDGAWTWGTSIANSLSGRTIDTGGSIAWAFNTFNVEDCVVSVEVLCRVTKRRKQRWQAETHAKLLTAFKARMQEYEEKLARLKLETGISIQGTNPAANLITIKSELKKSCISILTAQHYDLFGSISKNPSSGYPEINIFEAEAEGAYVRFFEQAFEWDQIMYITYPYFWGRMKEWIAKLTINDPDPVFDDFLKSGFARVVVPARPGFEGAIDHFMQFGEIWNGGPLPFISSKLYVPIADEIAERTGKPQGELPQGDPWEVLLPTTLVKLRGDDKLPTWHKNPDGKWEPDN